MKSHDEFVLTLLKNPAVKAECEALKRDAEWRRRMPTISVQDAQAHFPELINQVAAGAAIVITRDEQPVAQITPVDNAVGLPVPGRCRGMITILAEDDEHLGDFREYMP